MLTLVIPVYRNEGSIPDLLDVVEGLHHRLNNELETVFVVDGSPDRCYELLSESLPKRKFRSKLVLLSRNFGSFAAIRVGLELGSGKHFAVMSADLQEPSDLILDMDSALHEEEIDVVVGVRDVRLDPIISRIAARIFWGLYRRYVVPGIPPGGVDVFGCNRQFRDTLLKLDERHSSLIAQIFWLGFRLKLISYVRKARQHGKSAWSLRNKINYMMDSIFSFTDLPIRLVISIGGSGSLLAGLLGIVVLTAKLFHIIAVPGYTITMLAITFIGSLNLLGLGIVGSYAWRTYENTKGRPLAVVLKSESFGVERITEGAM